MSTSRLNRKLFIWAHSRRGVNSRGLPCCASKMFTNIRLLDLLNFEMCNGIDLAAVNDTAFKTFKNEWSAKINRIQAWSGHGSNKSRTYRMFKSEYGVEPYVLSLRARGHRSALARLTTGVAPIIIEIGRYRNTPVNNRECPSLLPRYSRGRGARTNVMP